MQGFIAALKTILFIVSKSLDEPIPDDIDQCLYGYRFIVEFSGKDCNIELCKAETLDVDWELSSSKSELFKTEILKLIDIRNKEYSELLQQEIEIKKDRLEQLV